MPPRVRTINPKSDFQSYFSCLSRLKVPYHYGMDQIRPPFCFGASHWSESDWLVLMWDLKDLIPTLDIVSWECRFHHPSPEIFTSFAAAVSLKKWLVPASPPPVYTRRSHSSAAPCHRERRTASPPEGAGQMMRRRDLRISEELVISMTRRGFRVFIY